MRPFRLSPGLFLEIDIGKLLTVVVTQGVAVTRLKS